MQDPAPPWRPGEHRRLPVSREWRESRTRGSRSSIAGASTGEKLQRAPRDVHVALVFNCACAGSGKKSDPDTHTELQCSWRERERSWHATLAGYRGKTSSRHSLTDAPTPPAVAGLTLTV